MIYLSYSQILLTGGAGFIGSHVAEQYLDRGYKAIVVDNLSSGCLENLKKAQMNSNFLFYDIDIKDITALRSIFQNHKPEIINHHAAQKSVPYSITHPIIDAQENILGLLNLITLAKEYGVQAFLYISSGGALSKPINGDEKSRESDTPLFESPYAITKYAGESYIKLYAPELGFQYSILRYANVFGPRQVTDGECGVVPIFVNNILANMPSILMTYSDMPRGCTRDYVYVDDIAHANMLLTKTPANTTVNIGTGREVAILDIYETIQNVFNSDLPISVVGPRAGDIKRSVLDSTRLEELTGWQPAISLKDGLERLKSYIENHE